MKTHRFIHSHWKANVKRQLPTIYVDGEPIKSIKSNKLPSSFSTAFSSRGSTCDIPRNPPKIRHETLVIIYITHAPSAKVEVSKHTLLHYTTTLPSLPLRSEKRRKNLPNPVPTLNPHPPPQSQHKLIQDTRTHPPKQLSFTL